MEELSLKLDFSKLDTDFLRVASAPVFQRLGYLLDCVLEEEAIADSKEHFSVFPMARVPFSVKNDWFRGECEILTYELDELVGTNVRALYQRLKGRGLFDVYTAVISGKLDLERVMAAYDRYLRFVTSHAPTYKEFVLNMDDKMQNPEFLGDTAGLPLFCGLQALDCEIIS